MTIRRRSTLGFLLLGASGWSSGAALLENVVEDLLIAELPRVLGPAARYGAKVIGAWPDGSHFEQVRVVGERVARPGNPVIDRLEADLRDVEVDALRRQVDSIGDAQASAHVRAADLAAFLRRQGWVQGATVTFSGRNGITVTGRPSMAGFTTAPALGNAEFRGRLLPQGSQLRLAVDAVRIAGFEATELTRAVLEGTINPILDTSAYAVPSRIDAVEMQGGAMVIRASGSGLKPAAAAPR
ncbi:LmeA family phospholipid-binding protein [Methylibium sp.]|uniref:LmeA family phospholipid-binding protein n=1 Tax=Methylibium sp. TaxID=2067992 RepID=UPI0017EED8F6|nr:LmeA family phospholipid-binding protein [Methylibium sp.]MBA3592023.1 LmeA family phospholipid-binding protein [Methylibium sp.]